MVTIALYTLGVLLFAVALIFSIALHELGHLVTAKKFGCRVSEYMVGFGKTVFSFTPTWKGKRSETTYGLKMIPFGGYVKIIGMYPPNVSDTASESELVTEVEDLGDGHELHRSQRVKMSIFKRMVRDTRIADAAQVSEADEDRVYYKLAWWKKCLVMAAGPAMNIAIAFFCFLMVFGAYGVRTTEPVGSTVIDSVSDCVIADTENRSVCTDADPVSPAALAGIEVGDSIVTANGAAVGSWDELSELIRASGNEEITFSVLRDGSEIALEPVELTVMMRDVSERGTGEFASVGFVGIGPVTELVVEHEGVPYTVGRMGEMISSSLQSIVHLPAKVFNVAAAVAGVTDRDDNGPVSVVGGSRLAGEVASNTSLGMDVADKAAMLGTVIGSFNLFIGVFNLLPLLPLDGGHIVGALYEKLRRMIAKVFKRSDPGHVDTAKQLPVAYIVAMAFVGMTLVLVIGDLVVPVSSGL